MRNRELIKEAFQCIMEHTPFYGANLRLALDEREELISNLVCMLDRHHKHKEVDCTSCEVIKEAQEILKGGAFETFIN
jgi:hypothetical protein